jgi:predicted RNA binding protein YcfA (HicA-like mRNA interferase family)
MTKLPSAEKIMKVLLSQGFLLKSQKGSHQKFSNGERTVIVPAGRKEIPIGTLKSISRQSGLDYENFINL